MERHQSKGEKYIFKESNNKRVSVTDNSNLNVPHGNPYIPYCPLFLFNLTGGNSRSLGRKAASKRHSIMLSKGIAIRVVCIWVIL